MFTLEPNPTFTAPVSIPLPGGEIATVDFTFAHKGRKALQRFLDRVKDMPDAEAVAEILGDWSGISGADGEPLPYTPEALEALLDNHHGAAMAILQTYIRELTGARVKN
jgi:hypothetical protein